MDELLGLLGTGGQLAGQAASAYLPYQLSGEQIDYLKGLGPQLQGQAETIGQTAAERAAFTPFTVTTSTGGQAQVGAGGALTQQLGQTEQQLQEGLLSQALAQAGQTSPTAESLFQQMQAIRAPEQARQDLQLEQRLFGQGRGGVQTSAYGGTPEQFALAKAREEQQSADLLTALTQAPALQQANIQNLSGLLGAAYAPQTQQIAALQPSVNLANIAQSAGLGAAESLYKGGIAGLEAQAAAGTAASALEGQRVRALADALTGYFGTVPQTTATGEVVKSPYELLLDALGGGGSSGGSTAAQVANQANNIVNWDQQGIE